MSTMFEPRRHLDQWSDQRGLEIQWSLRHLERITASGAASRIFSYVHARPERRLGHTLAFFEMLLGRDLAPEEIAGYHPRLEEFGLHPIALERLVAFADGLFRIEERSLASVADQTSFEGYRPKVLPEERLCWYFDAPPYQYGQSPREVGGRRRDWNKADYELMPAERYMAYRMTLDQRPRGGLETQLEFSRLVFGRPVDRQDVVDGLIFVPREMALQPAGFSDLCAFVAEQYRIGQLRMPENWAEKYPEMFVAGGE